MSLPAFKTGYLQRSAEKRVRFDCTPPVVHLINSSQASRADCPPPAPGLPTPARGGGNNVDIFRQINALLDNTLDLRGIASSHGLQQGSNGDFNRGPIGKVPRPDFPRSDVREQEVPHIDANLLAAARGQIQSSSSSMDLKGSPPPPLTTTATNVVTPPPHNGGGGGSDILPFLPPVPGSPISQSTWSSHPVCSNPKDAITLSNIDRYLSGGGGFQEDANLASLLESSPAPSDHYASSGSVSSPGSDSSSALWDCVFTPIKQAMGVGTRDQKCPSPSESDSSGVSSAGSVNDVLAETLSEMMGNLSLAGEHNFRYPVNQMTNNGFNSVVPNNSSMMLLQGGAPGVLPQNLAFLDQNQALYRTLSMAPNQAPLAPPAVPPQAPSTQLLDFNDPNVQALTRQLLLDPKFNTLEKLFNALPTDPSNIEKLAKLNRQAAAICQPTCTWSGQLPPKVYRNPIYSCKVFLGGVPWDITEAGLQASFKPFGMIRVEWPGKDGKHPRYPPK
ncbi:cytoplasmic polyadenylation element-binding protein 1-like, partial [Diadema antillarum]|uniref:cytoplasmic polyadenylation element-binding protein 1-like n=1 Tax=Diadema antillarum TaxID=105358 RepID=UPI003A8398B4